jgi:hypothetical protein
MGLKRSAAKRKSGANLGLQPGYEIQIYSAVQGKHLPNRVDRVQLAMILGGLGEHGLLLGVGSSAILLTERYGMGSRPMNSICKRWLLRVKADPSLGHRLI